MAEDDTIRLAPKPRPRRGRVFVVVGCVIGLGAAGLAAALIARLGQPPPVVIASHPAATVPPAALRLASEADILADQPERLTLVRFGKNDRILVLGFPDLRGQGRTFNRMAAFAEKAGAPHDRLLTDTELDQAIQAHGATVETFYYGHDYPAATVRRFFALAERDHVALNPEELAFRAIAEAQGMLREDDGQAVITLPREGADASVDALFRRTILRHELSHGEYFTNPAYADFVRRFWDEAMDDRARFAFRTFLAGQDYDRALLDLTINETQAFLMHTRDDRVFNAEALGLPAPLLASLQGRFLVAMPPGWLRDCTTAPGVVLAGPGQPPPPVSPPPPAPPRPRARPPRRRRFRARSRRAGVGLP